MTALHLRLDADAMRSVAKELDATVELSTRMAGVIPTLADGYDLPPGVADDVRATTASVAATMRRAIRVTDGLGRDLRARATLADLADLADQAGEPGGLAAELRHRLHQVVENFQCPLDDPATKLLFDAASSAAGGANLAMGELENALGELVGGQVADRIREYGNDDLDGCQPPVELPEPPPPPPPPPPKPGWLEGVADKVGGALDGVGNAIDDTVDDIGDELGDALPAPGEGMPGFPLPLPGPRGFPAPPAL